jgi:large subunit ribosomal protein L15e
MGSVVNFIYTHIYNNPLIPLVVSMETFEESYKTHSDSYKSRILEWRGNERAVIKLEKPTNPARARTLGYKAKKGFVIALSKVKKGGRHKSRPTSGRRPKRMGVKKYTAKKSLQWTAEERAQRHFKNLEVLNSYWVGDDGVKEYYEVIFVDLNAPELAKDPALKHLRAQKGRVYRGLTSAGKKSRGLSTNKGKGKGTERNRPSIGYHSGRGK